MHMLIHNSLPFVYLYVVTIVDEENIMRILVDTGAAMNTGNKIYH